MALLIDHPCVQHKLAIIRDVETGHKRFRELATEITKFICYEALKNVATREVTVRTPVADASCRKIDTDLVVVPILRAGEWPGSLASRIGMNAASATPASVA